MNEADYRRALLLTRIEAQRSILGLELRLARATLDPLAAGLSLLGVERSAAHGMAWSLRSLAGRGDAVGLASLIPLLVAALLPLLDRLRGGERDTDTPAADTPPASDDAS